MSIIRGIIRQDTIYDKLIFSKIRNMLGGEIIRSGMYILIIFIFIKIL